MHRSYASAKRAPFADDQIEEEWHADHRGQHADLDVGGRRMIRTPMSAASNNGRQSRARQQQTTGRGRSAVASGGARKPADRAGTATAPQRRARRPRSPSATGPLTPSVSAVSSPRLRTRKALRPLHRITAPRANGNADDVTEGGPPEPSSQADFQRANGFGEVCVRRRPRQARDREPRQDQQQQPRTAPATAGRTPTQRSSNCTTS